jgi:archaemetzincin
LLPIAGGWCASCSHSCRSSQESPAGKAYEWRKNVIFKTLGGDEMQTRVLNIYWQPQCDELLNDVIDCLKKAFPWLELTDAGCKQVQDNDYDPSRYQYDALSLLEHLPDDKLAIWIVSDDIYHPGYRYLYGAALANKAVVSSFRPDTLDEFKKEVCHEVGHILGLKHCTGKCFMHVSRNGKQLEKKPLLLCNSCQKKINQAFSNK